LDFSEFRKKPSRAFAVGVDHIGDVRASVARRKSIIRGWTVEASSPPTRNPPSHLPTVCPWLVRKPASRLLIKAVVVGGRWSSSGSPLVQTAARQR
jgi:hypothetical protein